MSTLMQAVNRLAAVVVDTNLYHKAIDSKLLKSKGVRANIVRASGSLNKDPMLEALYADSQRAELPTPAYHWLDPIQNVERQLNVFLGATAGKNIPFYVLDIEQWWGNWGAWYEAIARRIEWALVPRLRPDLIDRHALQSAQYLSAKVNKPVLIYTSFGFVRSWAPGMRTWLGNYDSWFANYVISSPVKITTTWEELYRRYLPPIGRVPLVPDGTRPERIRGWQYSADLISLPGLYSDANRTRLKPADLNVFDPAWLAHVCDGTPIAPPPPPPPLQYRVRAWVTLGLRLRAAPNTISNILQVMPAGTVMTAAGETTGTWIRVVADGQNGWVHGDYVERI